MTSPMFVTTMYGERYGAFLTPHLTSVQRTHPEAEGVVIYQDLPRRELAILEQGFPRWRFVETNAAMGGSTHQRIPRKLHAWLLGAEIAGERPLALLDCDTVVMRPLDDIFDGTWDVAYTWKNERVPVNTGVMLASRANAIVPLLREMARRVEKIVMSSDTLNRACGSSGAADQHALRELIGFVNYDRDITIEIESKQIVCRGLPCSQFNETNCVPPGPEQRILHYKAGWHPILLDGAGYTENRPKEKCSQMFDLWHDHAHEAHRELAGSLVVRAAQRTVESYRPLATSFEERGILHSEMLGVCAVIDALGITTVIESGRARGQSTLQLARHLEGTGRRLVSLELTRDSDAIFAEERLSDFDCCELRYGDAFEVLPEVLAEQGDTPVAMLMDGPKGRDAIELIGEMFERFDNLRVAFLHDTRRETAQRDLLEASGMRVFFTDDEDYVREFCSLDDVCKPSHDAEITMHTWRPNMKGEDAIPSYGPTLCILLPTPGISLTVRMPQEA